MSGRANSIVVERTVECLTVTGIENMDADDVVYKAILVNGKLHG